jgi:hypothetical protein
VGHLTRTLEKSGAEYRGSRRGTTHPPDLTTSASRLPSLEPVARALVATFPCLASIDTAVAVAPFAVPVDPPFGNIFPAKDPHRLSDGLLHVGVRVSRRA